MRTVTVELTEEQAEYLIGLCKHQNAGAIARIRKAGGFPQARPSDTRTAVCTSDIWLALDDGGHERAIARDYAAGAAER